MKILILALLLTLSLVCITNAYRIRSNNPFRDHLIEGEHQNLMDQSQRELKKQWQRYEEDLLGDDESNDDGYKKTYARRKAVGLGDNPFK